MMFRTDPEAPEADPVDIYPPTDEELTELIEAGNDPRFIMEAAELPF